MNDHATFMWIQNDADPATMPMTKGFELGAFLGIDGMLIDVDDILWRTHGQSLFKRFTQYLIRLDVP